MISVRQAAILAALAVLCACSANGPVFSEAPRPTGNDALVYVYRPSSKFFAGIHAHFFIDEVEVAGLNIGGYSWFRAPAGRHDLRQKWPGMGSDKIDMPIELKPNERYYYRITNTAQWKSDPVAGLGVEHKWVVELIPEPQALSEIRQTRLQPAINTDPLSRN